MNVSLLESLRQLLHQPEVLECLQRVGLVIARVLPVVAFTPIFGGMQVPARFRFSAALAMSLPLALALPSSAAPLALSGWASLAAREFFIGGLLAFGVAILFHAVAAAGSTIDMLRGDQAPAAFDPLFQRSESTLSAWLLQASTAVFVTLGGHREVLLALAESYRYVGLSGASLIDAQRGALAPFIIGLLGEFLLIVVRLSAPVIAAVLLVDLAVGLSGRLAARLNLSSLAPAIKGLLALSILCLALRAVLGAPTRALSQRLQAVFALAQND